MSINLHFISSFLDIFIFEDNLIETVKCVMLESRKRYAFLIKLRSTHARHPIDYNLWLYSYHETQFCQLFRMKKKTFYILLETLLQNDTHNLIKKKYRGGNYPVEPEKSLLVFLWYISKQDTLHSIADRFNLVPSSVMQIVNVVLYIVNLLKHKYIFWPNSEAEYNHIISGFKHYPGVVGAVDGSHVRLKVPTVQHDSYIDRYQQHSINLMGVCTAEKIFTYIFIGYPGSAHDSRVLSNSSMVQHIARYGKSKYFPKENYHLIGDSAFPLRTWLMIPFKKNNLSLVEKRHNYYLSTDRVCIENTFGILKGRFARLQYINAYSIGKAVEIVTSACILHNFCYLNKDEWFEEEVEEKYYEDFPEEFNDRQEYALAKRKRTTLANSF